MNKFKINQVWEYNKDSYAILVKIIKISASFVEGIVVDCSANFLSAISTGEEFTIYIDNITGKFTTGWSLIQDVFGEECIYCNKFYNEAMTKQIYNIRYNYNSYYFCCWECEVK